jgi:hypothetical protein
VSISLATSSAVQTYALIQSEAPAPEERKKKLVIHEAHKLSTAVACCHVRCRRSAWVCVAAVLRRSGRNGHVCQHRRCPARGRSGHRGHCPDHVGRTESHLVSLLRPLQVWTRPFTMALLLRS